MSGAFPGMENGVHNGVRSNHDRDPWTNGVNGTPIKREISPDKSRGFLSVDMANGGDGSAMDVDSEPHAGMGPGGALAVAHHSSMDDLPDEIQHITTDILPLSLILTRLAQFSHGRLQDEVLSLASKPLPQIAVNGNVNYQFTGAEDTSQESLEKKMSLIKTAQDLHTRWVKLLVIGEWSKKADKVSRLIDIRAHLASKLEEFNVIFWNMIKTKQDLHWAKLPSPDLKTALEVLSYGEVSWLPELGYLEPPPMTLEEKETWIDNINTMLSVRLSFGECEKIPLAFRNYTIHSGRVTFKVQGEFEVDLTIGDEDFEKQFWFIDFRFTFTPAPAELTEPLRLALEAKVNQVLAIDGLSGCYKYLHEFVLTQKITEFWRQALELSRARWIDTLSVERLNRAMAVQYWVNRPHSQGSKCWIILGVTSGNGPAGSQDPKAPSSLSLRWFRDNKEVKEFDIPFDVEAINAEDLLTTVIARHVEYLLGSMHNKLLTKPRFIERQARMAMELAVDDPSDSFLIVQLVDQDNATVRVDTMTGSFTVLPPSPLIIDAQRRLNSSPNPAEDGAIILEQLRTYYTMKDLSIRARSIGWNILRPPITAEELKTMVHSASSSREVFQAVWLRKVGWTPQWFVIMTMSLAGDQWWLVELSTQRPGPQQGGRVKTFTNIPMASGQLNLSDTFFQNLTVYVTGMISQLTDLRELHNNKMSHGARPTTNYNLPPQIKLPTIFVRLSDMLRPRGDAAAEDHSSTPWAKEFIPIFFRGVQSSSGDQDGSPEPGASPRRDSRIKVIAEARLAVTNKAKFQLLKGNVDHDVAFDPRIGQFSLRLRADMGTPVVTLLAARIQALERLVDFVEAIRRAGKSVVAESVTLREVVFTYSSGIPGNPAAATNALPGAPLPQGGKEDSRAWRVRLDLAKDQKVGVTLESGNPHLRALDMLKETANSPSFESLPSWLLISLPLFRALERIEDSWATVTANGEGLFETFHKTLSLVTIRFVLAGGPRRLLNIDIRPRTRKGKTVWHVHRPDIGFNGVTGPRSPDEFDRVLQKVWALQGEGVKGLGTSAAAEPEKGIERLLAHIDKAVRPLVGTQPTPTPAPAAVETSTAPQPQPQPQPQPPAVMAPQLPMQSAPVQQPGARFSQQAAMMHQQQQQQLRQQQQQANSHAQGQMQIHQRGGGGGGGGIGSSSAPVVVLD